GSARAEFWLLDPGYPREVTDIGSRWVCAVGSPGNYCKLDKTLGFQLFGEAEREARSLAEGECLAQHSFSWNKDSAPAFPSRQRIQLSFAPR
ncbi:hypothetical protein Nmel_017627, partial [Mimus melanotis]